MLISRGCLWDLSTHSLTSFSVVRGCIMICLQNDGSPNTRLRIRWFTAQILYAYVVYKREVVSAVKITSPDTGMDDPLDCVRSFGRSAGDPVDAVGMASLMT